MGLDQNLYLCKGVAKNGLKSDNEVLDKYFRKNYPLHRSVEYICNQGNSTNVEYIWISKEQWELIKKNMKPTKKNIKAWQEAEEKDEEWIKDDLKEFGEAVKEIEAHSEFKTGAICYYSWW